MADNELNLGAAGKRDLQRKERILEKSEKYNAREAERREKEVKTLSCQFCGCTTVKLTGKPFPTTVYLDNMKVGVEKILTPGETKRNPICLCCEIRNPLLHQELPNLLNFNKY